MNFFFMYEPGKVILSDEKHAQNRRVVVTILIAVLMQAMQHDDPRYSGLLRCCCIFVNSFSYSVTKHDATNAVITGWSSVRGGTTECGSNTLNFFYIVKIIYHAISVTIEASNLVYIKDIRRYKLTVLLSVSIGG